MSVHDAMNVFGVKTVPTDKELSARYRELAKKFHPDHGGSVADMQRLNAANDVLKNYASTEGNIPVMNYKETAQEYWRLAKGAKAILKKKFNPKAFTSYFENIFQKRFSAEVSFYPEKESGAHPYYAGIKAKFSSDDNETFFDLNISIYLTDMRRNTSIGSEDFDIALHVIAYGFHDNKKQKMAQRDWQFTNTHSILDNPQEIYPEAKLRKSMKGTSSKFAKKDAMLFLQSKLNATFNKEYAYIPLNNDLKIIIYRMTFMKVPAWMPNGIYEKGRRVRMLSPWTLPETVDAFKELEAKINKIKKETDPDKIDSVLSSLRTFIKKEK